VRSGPLILTCEGIGGEQVRLGRADGLGLVGFSHVLFIGKSPVYLPQLSRKFTHLPQLLKQFILPPGPVISGFIFFFFIYFD
jgi:hypothetical protein